MALLSYGPDTASRLKKYWKSRGIPTPSWAQQQPAPQPEPQRPIPQPTPPPPKDLRWEYGGIPQTTQGRLAAGESLQEFLKTATPEQIAERQQRRSGLGALQQQYAGLYTQVAPQAEPSTIPVERAPQPAPLPAPTPREPLMAQTPTSGTLPWSMRSKIIDPNWREKQQKRWEKRRYGGGLGASPNKGTVEWEGSRLIKTLERAEFEERQKELRTGHPSPQRQELLQRIQLTQNAVNAVRGKSHQERRKMLADLMDQVIAANPGHDPRIWKSVKEGALSGKMDNAALERYLFQWLTKQQRSGLGMPGV